MKCLLRDHKIKKMIVEDIYLSNSIWNVYHTSNCFTLATFEKMFRFKHGVTA